SLFWFLVLCAGSYWSLIAPIVLVKRGGHLRDPKKKKIRGFPHIKHKIEQDREKRRHMKDDPADYTPESEDGLLQMVMRSQPKGRGTGRRAQASREASSIPLPVSSVESLTTPPRSLPPYDSSRAVTSMGPSAPASSTAAEERLPSASEGMTALSTWSKGVRGTPQDAHARWTRRQIESRHHFIIWPICALLLTFAIVTIELQIALNDVFPGEMALDFPGVLTFFLALPTAWAVGKALRRIQEGRRPTPLEREDKTFLELAAANNANHDNKGHRNRRRQRRGGSTTNFSIRHGRDDEERSRRTRRRDRDRRITEEEEEGEESASSSQSESEISEGYRRTGRGRHHHELGYGRV
ncbi:hypothetical protein JCM3766R1_001911, partial [Sporobolomyces carnicolor]